MYMIFHIVKNQIFFFFLFKKINKENYSVQCKIIIFLLTVFMNRPTDIAKDGLFFPKFVFNSKSVSDPGVIRHKGAHQFVLNLVCGINRRCVPVIYKQSAIDSTL